MSPLNQKRVELVPTNPGSDCRDLPITVVELEDGTITRRLEYQHRNTSGRRRGVCTCALYSRKSQYAGRYGRVDWDGTSSTLTTMPDPTKTQGRVLHP